MKMKDAWCQWMLTPLDYSHAAIHDTQTRAIMQKIQFQHGGPEYDSRYPDGIPTSVEIRMSRGRVLSSGLMMYPMGHARNTHPCFKDVLHHKFLLLGEIATTPTRFKEYLKRLSGQTHANNVNGLYQDFSKMKKHTPIDSEDFTVTT